jgi:hypothetical protein
MSLSGRFFLRRLRGLGFSEQIAHDDAHPLLVEAQLHVEMLRLQP